MQGIFKRITSVILTLVMCLGLSVVVSTGKTQVADAAVADTYYDGITAKSGTALLGQLHDLITTTHKTYTSYDDCKRYGPQTDPGLDGRGVLEFYTHETITKFVGGIGDWNREHVWCQSLSGGMWGTSGGGSDMHHIRPSESGLNSIRGNNKYGKVNGGKEAWSRDNNKNDSRLGGHVGGGTFEPLDNVKGDVARIVMYVYTHYNSYSYVNGTTNGSGKASFGQLKFTQVMTASSEDAAKKLLLEWNALDPVDEIERTRNEEVYKIQGNRNPFIDNSSYAEAIWGDGSTTPPEPVELQSLSLNKTSVTIENGRSYNLTVTPNPANAPSSVTWSTSDSSVATVSNGRVTAKGEGSALITATSTVKPSVKATATVTVTPATIPDDDDLVGTFNIAVDLTAASDVGKVLYFNGQMANNYYFGTTENSSSAAEVVVRKDGDGYTFESDGKYLEVIKVDNYINVTLSDSSSRTWKYDNELHTFTWRIDATGKDYYLGTRTNNGKTYTTISASETKYITGDNAANVGVTQFIVDFVEPGTVPEPPTPPVSGIEIVVDNYRFEAGNYYNMSVVGSNGEAISESDIIWKSSNNAVAYHMDDEPDILHALHAGTCTITATLKGFPQISATFTVTVVEETDVLIFIIAGIGDDGEPLKDIDMQKGESETLYVLFDPLDKSVGLTWSSSDTAVATVDQNGKVTAVGAGTCEIKIVSKENSNVTDSVNLTVTDGTTQDSENVKAFKTALANIANVTEDDGLSDFHAAIINAVKAYNKLGVSEKALVTTEAEALDTVISVYNITVEAINSVADSSDEAALKSTGSFFKWVNAFIKAQRGE